jgi:hypothetical protein
MFRAPKCPSSEVQIVTTAFGDQPWKATSSELCTHPAAQRYTTQAAFQGWSPNAVVTICNPDDGHVGARNMLSQ